MKRTREDAPLTVGTPSPTPSQPSATSSTAIPPPAKKPAIAPPPSSGVRGSPSPSHLSSSLSGVASVSGASGASHGMPKVQDALGYLDKVKSRYSATPAVYNQFLDIMKDFKSANIDTEGVIRRVKTLFAGHRSLILGFNQFLPPGYKIDTDDKLTASASGASTSQSSSASSTSGTSARSSSATPSSSIASTRPSSTTGTTGAGDKAAAGGAGAIAKPTVEFNHAVNYVAKIKHRFRDQPQIYSEFLDILHDYQAKRTIEEVYTRVQRLFGNEPDLLEEFRDFLPDTGPAAPKPITPSSATTKSKSTSSSTTNNRTGGSSSTSSARKPSSTSSSSSHDKDKDGTSKASRLVQSATNKSKPSSSTKQSSSHSHTASVSKKDRSSNNDSQSAKKVSSKESKDKSSSSAGTTTNNSSGTVIVNRPTAIVYPPNSDKELAVLDRLHSALPKHLWSQFIKLLNMFATELITRTELIRLCEDLLLPSQTQAVKHGLVKESLTQTDIPNMSELFERFKQCIGYEGESEERVISGGGTGVSPSMFASYYAFVSSIDFTTCPQVTPSYRQLPAGISTPYCSGRTALCEAVLNDTCISIPTGSEDFSFKATRKNIYEENLFKVEDERFELDMIIENNAATIRVLEPIVEAAANMSAEQAKQLKINDQLDMLHLRSIARLYGENGYEMVELLQHCPAIASKVILDRLHQKDEEWRRVRHEMKNVWRRISESNYQRSLDHRSFYFKQEDKKRRGPKALVAELKEVHARLFELSNDDADKDDIFAGLRPGGEESVMLRQIRQGHVMAPLYTYCMHFSYTDDSIHYKIYQLICKMAAKILKLNEKELIQVRMFFLGFVHSFFGVKPNKRDWDEYEKFQHEVTSRENNVSGGDDTDELTKDADDNDDDTDEKMDESDNGKKRGKKSTNDDSEAETQQASSNAQKASAAAAKKRKGKRPARAVRTRKPAGVSKVEEKTEAEDEEADEIEIDTDVNAIEQLNTNTSTGANDGKLKGDEVDLNPQFSPSPYSGANNSNQSSSLSLHDITARILAADKGFTNFFPSAKQLHVANTTFATEEKINPVRKHNRPSHLFFGSHAYYVFFRLHQFLYDRLSSAKQLAHKQRRGNSKKKVPQTGEDRFAKFENLLDGFIFGTSFDTQSSGADTATGASVNGGSIDSAKFEDECRNLLGASSYVLFTLDKLLNQLLKQVMALINSEISQQLLSLYAYELRRAALFKNTLTDDLNGWLCRVYSMQVSQILTPDNLTQIEFFLDSKQLGIGLTQPLTISDLLARSPERVLAYIAHPLEFKPEMVDRTGVLSFYHTINPLVLPPTATANANSAASNHTATLIDIENYVYDVDYYLTHHDSYESLVQRPFLLRSLKRRSRIDERDFIQRLGLGIKLCLRSMRITYVDDTADCLMRVKHRSKQRRTNLSNVILNNVSHNCNVVDYVDHPIYEKLFLSSNPDFIGDGSEVVSTIVSDRASNNNANSSSDDEMTGAANDGNEDAEDMAVDNDTAGIESREDGDVVEASALMSGLQQQASNEAAALLKENAEAQHAADTANAALIAAVPAQPRSLVVNNTASTETPSSTIS